MTSTKTSLWEAEPCDTRRPVVEGAHGIEKVGDPPCSRSEARLGLAISRLRMAHVDPYAGPCHASDQAGCAGKLRGDRNDSHDPLVPLRQPAVYGFVRPKEQRRVESAARSGVEERPLEVDPGYPRLPAEISSHGRFYRRHPLPHDLDGGRVKGKDDLRHTCKAVGLRDAEHRP